MYFRVDTLLALVGTFPWKEGGIHELTGPAPYRQILRTFGWLSELEKFN
jgi:hypothetical protein